MASKTVATVSPDLSWSSPALIKLPDSYTCDNDTPIGPGGLASCQPTVAIEDGNLRAYDEL